MNDGILYPGVNLFNNRTRSSKNVHIYMYNYLLCNAEEYKLTWTMDIKVLSKMGFLVNVMLLWIRLFIEPSHILICSVADPDPIGDILF